MIDLDSPLHKAIEAINIPEAWHRLGLEGSPGKSCKVPWRDDKKPSLSVYDNDRLFKDFSTGEGGNVVKFISLATNLSQSDAAKALIQWNGGTALSFSLPAKRARPPTPKTKPIKGLKLPALDIGKITELTDLRRSRGIPAFVAFELLGKRGMFGFCECKPKGLASTRCWLVTDPSLKNAQARPLYPDKVDWPFKAYTLPGSYASWPIGASTIEDCDTVLLTEGLPDLLAVATAAWSELDGQGFDRIGLCCMVGGSLSIAEEALPLFKGKQVKVFVHNDEAGRQAFDRWWHQLKPFASHLSGWISEREGEDFNDWASRKWLESYDGISLPETLLPKNERPIAGTTGQSENLNSNIE